MSFEDQFQLHPAGEVFRDHVISQVKAENMMLHRCNSQIEPSRDFLTKISISLRNVNVETQLLPGNIHSDDYVSIPIKTKPLPLLEFAVGEVSMVGQRIGYLPGNAHLLMGVRANSILLRFCLSTKVALEGVLHGLSVEDFARFENKTYSSDYISTFLSSGRGLQNPDSITFTPLMMLLDVSSELQSTLKLLTPLPSLETVTKDLTCQVQVSNTSWWESTAKEKPRSKLPLFAPSEDSRLATVAAFGCTDVQMEILAENHLLSLENNRLRQIQDNIGTVVVSHPAFRIKASLKNGNVAHTVEGEEIWRILITENVVPESIDRRNISRLAMSISGVRMTRATLRVLPARAGEDQQQLACFWSLFDNGIKMTTNIYPSQDLLSPHIGTGFAEMTIDFPLNTVSHILEVLGVQV